MPLLSMKNISKYFPGVAALDDVSIDIEEGEVLALIGENGAGKSTLMKVLSGVYTPDAGEIIFQGRKVRFRQPTDALAQGIRTVYQELSLFGAADVAHNIFVDNLPQKKSGLLDFKKLYEDTRQLLDKFGLTDINPRVKLRMYSIGRQQIIEILKAYVGDLKLLILDEPTSSLTEKETQLLFTIIRKAKAEGVSVIYISHILEEIFSICDRVVILRDGKYINQSAIAGCSKDAIVRQMVGREVTYDYGAGESEIKHVVLEAEHIVYKGVVKDVSLSLHAGEVLGLGGLEGSGRTEFVECLFGFRRMQSGLLRVNGKEVGRVTPDSMKKIGMAYITKDRKKVGLFMRQSVSDNMLSGNLDSFSNHSIVNYKKLNKAAEQYVERFSIKTPTIRKLVNALSGGNQQKVLLAMWLINSPSIVLVDEPTRGIDVGTKKEIHSLLRTLAKEGAAIIMASSDMPELISASDRILVFYEGEIRGEIMHEEADEHKVMHYASGYGDELEERNNEKNG